MRRLPLCLALVLVSSAAFADSQQQNLDPSLRGRDSLTDVSPKVRPQMLSFFVNIPVFYGVGFGWGGLPFGVGARYMLPILHNGLAPELNDSISLEFGADMVAFGGAAFFWGLDIPIEAMWTLYLVPKFAVYLKAGLAIELHFGNWCGVNPGWCGGAVWPYPVFDVGGMFKLSDSMTLRFELGYPGLKVGLGFNL